MFLILITHLLFTVHSASLACLDNCSSRNEDRRGYRDNVVSAPSRATVCGYLDNFTEPQTLLVGSGRDTSTCSWLDCGLSVLYPGPCGCPNDCFSDQGFGVCWHGKCVCNGNWTGPDCSSLQCANELCTLHGTCQVNEHGFEYCECDPGWTGYYCNSEMLVQADRPYGLGYFGNKPYYFKGEYDDLNHPLFNRSAIGTVFIDVDPERLHELFYPKNAYMLHPIPGTFSMLNGVVTRKTQNVEISLLGQTSRSLYKKALRIALQEEFYDAKTLLLKVTTSYGVQSQSISYDFLRALGVPIQRGSWVRVYVNSINFGLYLLQEAHDRHWVQAYFQDGTGGIMKASYEANLVYEGDDEEIYKKKTKVDFHGLLKVPIYDDWLGGFNYSKLVHLMRVLDPAITPEAEFRARILEIFNVEDYLKYLAFDVFAANYNSYSCQTNLYLLYDDPLTGKLNFIGDGYLNFIFGDAAIPPPSNGQAWTNLDPYEWCNFTVFHDEKPVKYPLTSRILADTMFKEHYQKIFNALLDDIYRPVGQRLMLANEFLDREYEFDHFTKVLLPLLDAYTELRVTSIVEFLDERKLAVRLLIPLYLPDQMVWFIVIPLLIVAIGPMVTIYRCLVLKGANPEKKKLLHQ